MKFETTYSDRQNKDGTWTRLKVTTPIAQRRETVVEMRHRILAPTTRERVDAALRGEES